MTDFSKIERTWQLLTTGHLPGWAGWLLAALLGAAVCWQLHRELAAAPSRIVVRWLFALRLGVVALAVWLLCKPVLLITERWREKPELVTLSMRRPSLEVRENFGGAHHGLDVVEALEQHATEGRMIGATAIGYSLEKLIATLEEGARRAANESEHLASALPPRPAFTESLPVLKQALLTRREDLARRLALLPSKLAHEKLTATRGALAGRLQALSGTLQAFAGEVDVIQAQGAAFPELFEKFAAKLTALAQDTRRLATDWSDLQAAMDEAAAAASPSVKTALERPRTRRDFASASVIRVNALTGVRAMHGEYERLATGLRDVKSAGLAPAAILVLDDGTLPLTAADRAALRNLSEAGVAVHAALIGADGVEPPDAGLVAVEAPGVVVAGQRIAARVLVKVGLAKGQSAKLIATAGETMLAQVEVKESGVVALPLRFDSVGRQSVVFALQTREPDAHSGNQKFATVIDVVARPLRVLVISDTMSADFALLRGVGERLSQLRVESILLDPQLGKFAIGSEPGQFPGTPEQWQTVSALVLLGGPAATIPPEALAGLPAAIEAGVRVLVIPPGAEGGWLPSLGLSAEVAEPAPILPRADFWLPMYALGRDETESRERWARLPTPDQIFLPVPAAAPLFEGGDAAALRLIPRGRGGILFAGVGSLASLRADGNVATVNRLVAALLETVARPWVENENGLILFPPQPVAGRKQLAAFGGAAPADLQGAKIQDTSLMALDKEEITFTHGGQKFRRSVHHLLSAGDFELTPHAAPLEEMARLGDGRFVELIDLSELLNDLHLPPVECQDARSYRLWSGGWPLAVLLLLVSAEYLLRRRAGRVM